MRGDAITRAGLSSTSNQTSVCIIRRSVPEKSDGSLYYVFRLLIGVRLLIGERSDEDLFPKLLYRFERDGLPLISDGALEGRK